MSLWVESERQQKLSLPYRVGKQLGRGSFGVVLELPDHPGQCVKVVIESHCRTNPILEFQLAETMGLRGIGPRVFETGTGTFGDDTVHWMRMERWDWSLLEFEKHLNKSVRKLVSQARALSERRVYETGTPQNILLRGRFPDICLCDWD